MQLRVLHIALALSAAFCLAASPIKWIEKDYEFGLMREVDGPKSASSRFVNISQDTIFIMEVKPSCGCTTASFTEDPIAPGDTAAISYTYNPKLRPGKFKKSVKVRLSDNSREQIVITGNVLGTPESLATLYPVDGNWLRLSDSKLNLGNVTFGRTATRFLNAYSTALDSISPSGSSSNPGLTFTPSSKRAGTGEVITFSVTLDAGKAGVYGPASFDAFISPDPSADNAIPVTITANILPNAGNLSLKQGAKHPICEPTRKNIDLGNMSSNAPQLATELTVKNPGDAPLDIFRVYSSSDAITVTSAPAIIKKGKKSSILISINPTLLNVGPQQQKLTLLTSDPTHTIIEIPININITN